MTTNDRQLTRCGCNKNIYYYFCYFDYSARRRRLNDHDTALSRSVPSGISPRSVIARVVPFSPLSPNSASKASSISVRTGRDCDAISCAGAFIRISLLRSAVSSDHAATVPG